MSDFQLIYMSHAEAGLYIISEVFFIPIQLPFAFFWVVTNWWVYGLWIIYEIFLELERLNVPKMEEEIHGDRLI